VAEQYFDALRYKEEVLTADHPTRPRL
jgi:hypothetical protein